MSGHYEPVVVATDADGRVQLPGHSHERFVLREQSDGSLLLQPARIVTAAQAEYDSDPELRALLARAAESRTVHRRRARRSV